MAISIAQNRDCMEAMKEFPDKFFDLAIVDPPYGIGESGANNHSRCNKAISKNYKAYFGNDATPPDRNYFIELKRVCTYQIIWGANHFIENIPFANSHCWVIWDKQNGATDFADCELAYTNFNNAARKFTFRWQGMLQGDMGKKETRIHPNQKPVQLYNWLLKNYAKPGFKILDTHLGSGSSRIAAHNLGFDFWGYEIDKEYFDAQENRFNPLSNNLFNL